MTEVFAHQLAIPEKGKVMDKSGLFGLELCADRMVRAIGPDGRRSGWAVIPEVAKELAPFWQPDPDFVADLVVNGCREEAVNEANAFVRVWDVMSPGETKNWMLVNSPEGARFALDGIARVEVREDGLVYLALANGAVSRCGIHPGAAVSLVSNWEGLDGAANLAAEYLSDRCDQTAVGAALMVRWDREGQLMQGATRHLAAAG